MKSNQVYLYLLFKRNIRNRRQRPHTVCRGTCNCCWPTKVLNEKHAVIEHFTVTRVYRVFSIIEDIPRFNFLFGVSIKCTYTGQPDLYNFRTNHATINNEYNESETHSERRPNKNKKWKNNENENQDTETQNIQTSNKPDQKRNKQTQAVKQNKHLEFKLRHTNNQDNITTRRINKNSQSKHKQYLKVLDRQSPTWNRRNYPQLNKENTIQQKHKPQEENSEQET